MSARRPALIFMWEQFSVYHVDRLEAVGRAFGDRFEVVGIEVAPRSNTYAWKPATGGLHFRHRILYPDAVTDDIPWRRKFAAFRKVLREYKPEAVFLCNQEHPEIMAACSWLFLKRVPAYAMLDAKFDDTPRRVLREAAKQAVFRLYRGGLVAGQRHLDYYRFLGLPRRWAATAYDTVSVERVRRQADVPLAPEGKPHAQRDFVVVARFVPKKNIPTAIRAYARFKRAHPESSRRLLLSGSGKLEGQFRALVAELGVKGVEFLGFLDADQVAHTVADSLALILPSVEEQWGLVVNEAVALGIPILCSDNVGARDTLVRDGVNGFCYEPFNDEGLAMFMDMLSEDEALWRRMSLASHRMAPDGDVAEFVRGVSELVRVAGSAPALPDAA